MHMHSNPDGNYVPDLGGKQLIPFGSYGMDKPAPHPPTSHDDFAPADYAIGSYAFGQPPFPPHYTWPTFYNQNGFPPTSSTLIHSVIAKDTPQGIFQIQESRMCITSGSVSDFNYNNVPYQMDDTRANPYVRLANHNTQKALITTPTACFSYQQVNKEFEYCDVPRGRELVPYGEVLQGRELLPYGEVLQGRELVPYGEGQSKNNLTSTQNWIHGQDHTSPTPESTQHGSSSCQSPLVTVAVPGFNSRKRAPTPNSIAERHRRARINEKLKSLHELLPHNDQGKEVAMENIVDYVKYLQLQAKALSQSKLGGGATNDPFIHLEGFGHYLLNQQTLNEPLEEIIGKMMKDNMPAVTQLLETKGLYLMPMSLAEGISGII